MKKCFLVVILLFPLYVFSQQSDYLDTSNIDTVLQQEMKANIDSLLQTWYVKNSVKYYNADSIEKLNHYTDIADTIIIDRLKKIPTPIHLTYNQYVRNWINLYLKRQKKLIPLYLGLGQYYFPIFEQILDKYKIPLEIKYLPIVESAMDPFAVSRSGATGLWQFMLGTGLRYDLEINSLVDERLDPVKETEAAAKYLKDMYDIYGDWLLVLAAYNSGPANVNKAIRRSGGKTSFWEIYPYLPRETRGYVPAFIAITYVMTYAKEHNFFPVQINLPLNVDTITITDTLHLKQVSEVLKIPYEQLKEMNPQYRWDIIPGYLKPYPLRLPSDKALEFIALSDSIYHYKDTIFFPKNFVIKPKRISRYGRYVSRPCPKLNTKGKIKLIHTVGQGEVLSIIADYYNVTVRQIKCWNNKYSSRLRLGEKLTIYVPTSKIAYYKRIANMPVSKRLAMINKTSNKGAVNLDPHFVYHRVRKGESIYIIAKQYPGITYQDIMKINGFTEADARRLHEGQYIKIKRK